MTVDQIDKLEELYANLGSIVANISTAVGATDSDKNSANRLRDAQECILDAVMIAIERSFDNGDLVVEVL